MKKFLSILFCLVVLFSAGCSSNKNNQPANQPQQQTKDIKVVKSVSEFELPKWNGKDPYTVVNSNIPLIDIADAKKGNFENYSELDSLGRCGVAYINACKELMPTEPRGKIGMVKPSGWQTVKYDCVDGKYLYNRCHLIAHSIGAENANVKNLITGTRYLNNTGMLPFESNITDFIKKTGKHVLYRVTPIFVKDELVARGVYMEALSVEDEGKGLQFCVFVHNVQPGIKIDYKTGKSEKA